MVKANVFLLSFVIFVSLSSLSHGLILNGLLISTLELRGFLRCTLTSNLNAPPISGQTVFLRCGGSSSNLAQAVTNPSGAVTIVYKIADTALFDPSSCRVTVNLPIASCSVFPPDGVLTATVGLVGVTQSSVGNIANYAIGVFRNI